MARKPATAHVDVRSQTLAVALRLFSERGFDGTAVQDVASAVGVSKQAVLHHFDTKAALRDAVLESLVEPWREQLPRLLVAAPAGEDRFRSIFGALHDFFAADPARARLILREALDRPEEMRALLVGAVKPWVEALASSVKSGQAQGTHFADVDAEAYLVHVLQFVISATALADVIAAPLGRAGRTRYDRELRRIAQASLFAPARRSR